MPDCSRASVADDAGQQIGRRGLLARRRDENFEGWGAVVAVDPPEHVLAWGDPPSRRHGGGTRAARRRARSSGARGAREPASRLAPTMASAVETAASQFAAVVSGDQPTRSTAVRAVDLTARVVEERPPFRDRATVPSPA